MSNRLLELERELLGTSKPRRKTPAPPASRKPNRTGGTTTAAPVAASLSAVDYSVPGLVAPIAQPTGMTCWATVTTMMISWRRQQSIPIETALAPIGDVWVQKFRNNQGLLGSEKGPFLAAAGLIAEPPQSLTIDGWERMLRNYGPIWVTTDEDPTEGFAIHARIVTGIHGDGTADGTRFDIVDPAGGRRYTERLTDFYRKFEEEARHPNRPLRVQIVHWPQDVSFGKQFNSGWTRQLGGPGIAIAELGVNAISAIASSNDGDVTWQVDQLQGSFHGHHDNFSDAQKRTYGAPPWTTATDSIHAYVRSVGGIGPRGAGARFEVEWQHNGYYVANVHIRNTGTTDLPGFGCAITATITRDQNAYVIDGRQPIAAVIVEFHYRFTNAIWGDKIFIGRYKLYGNGRFDYSGRWTQ